jgi:transcriptional regulator with XRE-family HTH domain
VQKDNTTDDFGGVIKVARNAKSLTQKELAAKLDISVRYLKSIENSGQKPSYRLLKSIISTLDIPAGMVL